MIGQENRVLAAVIERSGRFLLCRRPEHKNHGGLFEFPGGKLEVGECLADAARRELKEELALEVLDVGAVLFSALDKSSGLTICFTPVSAAGEPQLIEHSELRWVESCEVVGLPLAPSDRLFAEFLLTETGKN
ncbi:MAG TPA: NUDIX domain-containing protein [Candidatus Melainabacteria bacterium]|nr:NUDIX domain-containing protein [Candidatus Melainabacteria bacterium]